MTVEGGARVNQQLAVVEIVRYAGTTLRCPNCRQWRASLLIFEDGSLRCDDCPACDRRTRQTGKQTVTA
jgi:ssDNA-binding Zn-finger/Zn-ribbon topoisomerase 1